MNPTFRTSQPGSAADPSKPHLILVGLPGSGKSTVGQAVASETGRTFLDLDQEIERREGRSITQIFGENGEPYFRKRERQVTEELALVGNMVVAPGGGWMTVPDVVALVRPPSQIVYLRVRPETALRRLGPMRMARPLLSRPDPLAELKRLFDERRAFYETADKVVDTELISLQRVIEKVIELASMSGQSYVTVLVGSNAVKMLKRLGIAGSDRERNDAAGVAIPPLLAFGPVVRQREMNMTFRVLGPHERGRFAPEAWGHLLALTGSGALNAAELEHIIERALLQIDGRIALDDLRSLMEGAGFVEQSDGDQTQTVH